jgi:hypothetical protein
MVYATPSDLLNSVLNVSVYSYEIFSLRQFLHSPVMISAG